MLFGTFLCRPVLNYTVKWPNSKFGVEREHTTVNFCFSPWTVTPSLQIQFLDSSATLEDWTSRNKREKFERLWKSF